MVLYFYLNLCGSTNPVIYVRKDLTTCRLESCWWMSFYLKIPDLNWLAIFLTLKISFYLFDAQIPTLNILTILSFGVWQHVPFWHLQKVLFWKAKAFRYALLLLALSLVEKMTGVRPCLSARFLSSIFIHMIRELLLCSVKYQQRLFPEVEQSPVRSF